MAVALGAVLAGLVLLGLAVAGARGGGSHDPVAPVLVPAVAAPAPVPTAPTVAVRTPRRTARPAIRAHVPRPVIERGDELRFQANDRAHVSARWVAGFYAIYAQAQRTFGVNWLLIASVHKQETAFSTHPTTYHGLNFAHCCAGPMQFNVTNGPVSTWARYRDASTLGTRPADYPHATHGHPSVYDDYDAIMAAGALLHDSGAGTRLDASAWRAAYDYYGHDLTGITYADEVLSRAIGWGQRSFCINCPTDAKLLTAVDAAWGAPVRDEMTAAAKRKARARKHHAKA